MIVIIDNYDSFTYNIYQAFARLCEEEVVVLRNDEVSIEQLRSLNPSHLVISPGPGGPERTGISVEAIRVFAPSIPILGICLGHQAIAYAYGARIVQAKQIKHGIVEEMELDGKGVFRTIGTKGTFTRYHSLAIDPSSLPDDFEISAKAADGEIMGIRHKQLPLEGVQFHPESIASVQGDALFKAFLFYRRKGFSFKETLATLMAGQSMDRQTAQLFMEDLTEGVLDERQTSAILTALSAKGPSAEEIAGCAAVLSRKKTAVPIPGNDLTDIVGTGGDGKGSFNISSMAALVAAACGVKVAKHGNRAVSSLSGSADFFEALGIHIDSSPQKTAKNIEETGFGFLYAPMYHSAMRFAAPVRKLLGVKTIMNLVGPLSNPANASYQVIGVYDHSLLIPVAQAAHMLGAKRAMVVCSRDGFDEISPCLPTDAIEIDEKGITRELVIDPNEFGIDFENAAALAGGSAQENASLARELLEGRGRPALRAAVALNAGAAIYISNHASTIEEGYRKALAALEDGSVARKIAQVREAGNA